MRRRDTGRRGTTLFASVIAAIAASLWCIGPLAATLLGIGSFAAATAFESWRPYVLGVTFALLAAAFYYKREVACADGTCAVSRAPRQNKVMLWIATGVVILFAGGEPQWLIAAHLTPKISSATGGSRCWCGECP